MLNSDVICEFPLVEMLKYHQSHRAEGTILVTEVKDPTKYGVVVANTEGKISQFVEKPQQFVSNKINAGIYLFNVEILSRIELRPTSIEREIFPKMAADGQIFSMVLPGHWMDIGQPRDFLTGTSLHLHFMRKTSPEKLASLDNPNIIGNVLIAPDAIIGKDVTLGPDVVIGPGCVIGDGARIKRSTLMDHAKVKAHAFISNSIVGWHNTIGQWARVTESILGEDVSVSGEVLVNEATVCPHKEVKEDSPTPKIIL